MLKQNTSWKLRALAGVIAVVQVFDIFIHVATNQIEAIRITSNIIILLWLMAIFSLSTVNANFLKAAMGSIGAYLGLNIVFLMLEGVTNAEQGGALRVMLFVLVFLTVTLSTWLTYLGRKAMSNSQH